MDGGQPPRHLSTGRWASIETGLPRRGPGPPRESRSWPAAQSAARNEPAPAARARLLRRPPRMAPHTPADSDNRPAHPRPHHEWRPNRPNITPMNNPSQGARRPRPRRAGTTGRHPGPRAVSTMLRSLPTIEGMLDREPVNRQVRERSLRLGRTAGRRPRSPPRSATVPGHPRQARAPPAVDVAIRVASLGKNSWVGAIVSRNVSAADQTPAESFGTLGDLRTSLPQLPDRLHLPCAAR